MTSKIFSFVSQALPKDTFEVVSFTGREALNQLFSFKIELVSKDSNISGQTVLNAPATFGILNAEDKKAFYTGYLSSFAQAQHFHDYTAYTVELKPEFAKFTGLVQSNIFLNKNLQEAIHTLLQEDQFVKIPHEFRFVQTDYPVPEFSMQYDETLYDYIAFRLEEQGAYFFFDRENSKLIFADSPLSHAAADFSLRYAPPSGLETFTQSEIITAFTSIETSLPRRVVVRSYDWLNPDKVVYGEAPVNEAGFGDVYFASENVRTDAEAERIAKIRAEELRALSVSFHGDSCCAWLKPGYSFELTSHYNENFNTKYLVYEMTHEGSQEAYLSLGLGLPLPKNHEHNFYRNHFTCIKAEQTFRPRRQAKRAKIAGVVRAFIDGAGSGARAEMDGYGRYKLVFPFDVSGRSKGKASCWIRMAKSQVGNDHGVSFPLLPGAEVTVSFVDGDPDRPIITGALPNGETGSITGPGNANFSGIRTTAGNQITFNDTDNKQGISILAASGHGLSLHDGSPNTTTLSADNILTATGLCSNDITGMAKNLYSGYSTISAAMKGRKWFQFLPGVVAGIGKGVKDCFDSLAKKAAKGAETQDENTEKNEKIANDYAWGTDITELVTTMLVSGFDLIKAKKTPYAYYNATFMGSQNKAASILQVSPNIAHLTTFIGAWGALRATSVGLNLAKTLVEYNKNLDEAKEKGKDKDKSEEKQKVYESRAKQKAIREGGIQQFSSLVSDFTALMVLLITMAPKDSELGGVAISSPDRNININAAKTVSLHSPHGIFLNTMGAQDDNAKWGIKAPADLKYTIGHPQKSNGRSFVAINTSDLYTEASYHEAEFNLSFSTASLHHFKYDDDTFLKIVKNNIALQAKDSVSLKVKDDSGKILMNNTGVTITAGNNNVGMALDKQQKAVTLNGDTSLVTVNRDGVSLSYNQRQSYVDVGQNITLHAQNNKIFLGQIEVEGTNIKATGAGIIDLGGEVKIMGQAAALAPDLEAKYNELKGSIDKIMSAQDKEDKKAQSDETNLNNKEKQKIKKENFDIKEQDEQINVKNKSD
ncbi:MAG: type VI secretion system tip protein VgrG [Desulfovibrionaceae bacterium]|nr:type VI secretion system tip protein VgrG [Desulfovibrionaceae bacterium]